MDSTAIITILIIGIAAGVLSGLVGIGGGIILVPALIYFLKYNQHQAQGTSLGVLVLPVVFLGFYPLILWLSAYWQWDLLSVVYLAERSLPG